MNPSAAKIAYRLKWSDGVTRISTALVGLTSISVLVGWMLNVRMLQSILPHLTTMKANTAICFGLTAAAVWLSRNEASRRRFFPFIVALSLAALALATATLCEYAFHWNGRIDELFFLDIENKAPGVPAGRPAPGTAAYFVLLSISVLVLDRLPLLSHSLTITIILASLIGLIGYVYDLPTLYGAGHYTSLALHTIGCFLILCTGLLASRPQRGLTHLLIRSTSIQGSYTQFLAPGSVIVPIVLGAIVLYVQRLAGYGPEFTLALFSVLIIVLSFATVMITENERQKIEQKRLATAKALTESEERLRLALHSAAIGIWVANPITGEREWDSRCRAIFGFPPDLRIDANLILSCVHPEDRDLVSRSILEYVNPNGPGHFEVEHRVFSWTDGSLRYVFGQGRTVFSEDQNGRHAIRSVGTLQDITALKQGEDHLRRTNQELEQFAYAAAHDLQEPLRNVCLATQMLALRYKGKFDSDADTLLNLAAESPMRMQNMVRDLLAYSRALSVDDATEEASFEPADANFVLGTALSNLRLSIEEKQARISFDSLPRVRMRDLHLLQIFQNLVGNSLKYSGNKRPEIHVSCNLQDALCTFLVKDNGIGIPPEFHERAFLVFKRLHDKSLPGTGIGLALCRRLVGFYGGKIWIESVKNQEGSTFLFTAPLANRPPEDRNLASRDAEALKSVSS